MGNRRKRRWLIFLKCLVWIFVIVFSPVILLYYICKGIYKLIKRKKWERDGRRGKLLLMSSNISDIDIMEGYMFEEYLKTLLFYEGYEVNLTQKSRDYGADLVIIKDGIKTAVQAKRYNKSVGVKCVQEVLGAKKHYDCGEAMVITNSHFTDACEQLAKENDVRLVDREELIEMYNRVKKSLSLSTKESELVDNKNGDIEEKFPYLI